MSDLPPLHVQVSFGKSIPSEIQGSAMLAFEKHLRELAKAVLEKDARDGVPGPIPWIEVFKEAKGDDSKLRAMMTKEQRAKL